MVARARRESCCSAARPSRNASAISLPRGAIRRAHPTPHGITTRTGPRIAPARAKATCPRSEPLASAWAPPPTAEPLRALGKPSRSAAAAAAEAAAPLRRPRAVPSSRLVARRAQQSRAGQRRYAAEGGGNGGSASFPKTTPALAGRRGGWTALGRAALQLPRRGRTATEEGGGGAAGPRDLPPLAEIVRGSGEGSMHEAEAARKGTHLRSRRGRRLRPQRRLAQSPRDGLGRGAQTAY